MKKEKPHSVGIVSPSATIFIVGSDVLGAIFGGGAGLFAGGIGAPVGALAGAMVGSSTAGGLVVTEPDISLYSRSWF